MQMIILLSNLLTTQQVLAIIIIIKKLDPLILTNLRDAFEVSQDHQTWHDNG